TGLFHDDGGFPTNDNHLAYSQERRLLDKIRMNQDAIEKWEETDIEDAEVVIVCYGGTAGAASGALEKAKEIEGFPKVGMFRPVTVWPFPEKEMMKISEKCKHIIMAEHNDGQMLMEVQRAVKGNVPVSFVGKIDGTTITPDDILAAIREVYEDAK
ncbi:MAG: 2-oxoacid:acceptor oxidoreductase subunit alpha, partial [Firmicutes bacterium]|nr:2-oxoacid:acceptor oxidoreductase subunit alpha [Bacillota bacterium]